MPRYYCQDSLVLSLHLLRVRSGPPARRPWCRAPASPNRLDLGPANGAEYRHRSAPGRRRPNRV